MEVMKKITPLDVKPSKKGVGYTVTWVEKTDKKVGGGIITETTVRYNNCPDKLKVNEEQLINLELFAINGDLVVKFLGVAK